MVFNVSIIVKYNNFTYINYIIALETNEVHRHWDGPVTVPVQGLDVVQKVCKELVAPFKHTEGHNVMPTHFLHNLSGQSLGSGVTGEGERERETDRENSQLSPLLPSAAVFISCPFVSAG